MINPEVERRYADCSELVEAWRLFLDLVNRAVKQPEVINPEMEQEFLNAKARIAMLFDSFLDSLKHDRNVGSNMIGIVNRAITLKMLTKSSQAEAKKLEIEWHEVYLLLNETVTQLEEQREKLANTNEILWKIGKMKDRAASNFRAFLQSIWFKIIVGVGALLFIVWGIPAMGIYDWDNLRDQGWAKGVVGITLTVWRDGMGFNAPYMSVDKFAEKLKDGATPGLSHEDLGGLNQGQAIQAINSAWNIPPDTTTNESFDRMLSKASQFTAIKFSGDNSRAAFAFIFWYRNTQDAVAIDIVYSQHKLNEQRVPANWALIRKQNVISIIRSDPPAGDMRMALEHLDSIRSKRYDALK